jgi:hypothetical protein
MRANDRWLAARRTEAWRIGVELRERLLASFMEMDGLRERPLLKDVLDDLVQDVQDARLLDQVLPLDRYAQSEILGQRIVVTVNTRIAEIPGVKDAAGVRTLAVAHEAVHIDQDLDPTQIDRDVQLMLPDLDVTEPRVIVCRTAGGAGRVGQPAQEFRAENAALAMAIALPDLQRCAAFVAFQRRAADGGDLGGAGWRLLYQTAEFVGVNISALVTYFTHRGLCYVEANGGRQRLMAAPRLLEVDDLLEPVTWSSKSIAS